MLLSETISNSRFRFTDHPGTGNKSCKVSDKEKLRLSNVLIDEAKIDEFLNILYESGEKKMLIELSNRRTSRAWGTAWYFDRRVKIYRHTVWVFLHEVAHVLNIKYHPISGNIIRTVKPHGTDFGKHLSMLYDLWMEYCDKGVDNGLPMPVRGERFIIPRPMPKPKNQWKVGQRRPRIVGGISLQVNDQIWFRYKGDKVHGTVKRVNKKTCTITDTLGRTWRVSPRLLNKDATKDIDIPITKTVYEGLKKAMAFPDEMPMAATKPTPNRKPKMSAEEKAEVMKAWKAKYGRK
jgi:hypothetical protein